MSADASITKYPDSIYQNIAWAHDALYGYRNNEIFIIDWDTKQETKIGYLEGNTYYAAGQGNTFTEASTFEKDVRGITGILAENGKLSAQITFEDGSTDEFAACTYDVIKAFPEGSLAKTAVSGPSREPEGILYGFSKTTLPIMETRITIKGSTSNLKLTNGLKVPDFAYGRILTAIGENAFKDCGPDKLAGTLEFGTFTATIGEHAFGNCTGISGTLDLSKVYTLKPYSFYGCTGLDKVILCKGRNVDAFGFAECSGIREVVNLETAYMFGESAFEGCSLLSDCYDLCDHCIVHDNAFKDCIGLEIANVLRADYIGSSAFENCVSITGPLSIPNCYNLGDHPFRNTGITRLSDTDLAWHVGSGVVSGTQIKGILSFPALTGFRDFAFTDSAMVDAIRFPNPETYETNGYVGSLPESTDVALFVVKDSPMEELIKDTWTYGENYWYIDDVLASGELDNGILWTITGDGTMTLDIAEGITESVTVSGFAEAAPWDNFKKYVENIKIESEKIVLGSEAICGFANLRKVTFAPDSTYDENAFVDCEYLSPEDIVVIACNHEYGEWNRTKEPTCTRTGEEKRVCIKCGQTETKEVDPLGHIWGEWYVEREATETETGLMIRFCQREGDTDYRETQVIPKLEHVHDMVEHPAAEPTCTADGNTAYWECSKCGKYYADADATEEIIRDDWFRAAIGHDWGEWEVTKEATCTENGEKKRVCSRDDSHVDTAVIEATGHTEETLAAVEPTCTDAGLTEGKKCSICGEILFHRKRYLLSAMTGAIGKLLQNRTARRPVLKNGSATDVMRSRQEK